MHITILGAGNVGAALGKGWARAGHTIAYGVRNPGDPKHAAAAEAAHGAAVLNVADAAARGEVIVLATLGRRSNKRSAIAVIFPVASSSTPPIH